MTHTALARKYRPKKFADLVGQEHVAAGLSGAIVKNRVAHGYLLTGPRGVGKTTAARVLAMALNCDTPREERQGEPCGSCDSCGRIWAGNTNLDVVEIDAASHRGVDDARELRERAMYAASGPDRYKIYIVDEAHMLTREAWNALLKILEEPPPRVVFVFATTEPQKIANTSTAVLSRLQRFDFRAIGPLAIATRIREVGKLEGLVLEEDAVILMAQVARGGMRDALSLLDQVLVFGDGAVKASAVREALGLIDEDQYGHLLDLLAERRQQDVFPFVANLVEQGADLGEFLIGMGETLRALVLQMVGGVPEGLTEGLRDAIDRVAPEFTPGDILRMLALLAEVEGNIRRGANQRLHVETLLLHWTFLDRTVELEDVIKALKDPGGAQPAMRTPRRGPARPTEPSASTPSRRSAEEQPGTERPQPPEAGSPDQTKARSQGEQGAGDLTLDVASLSTGWSDLTASMGRVSPMIAGFVSEASPVAVEGSTVSIAAPSASLEALTRRREVIEQVISDAVGAKVSVTFVEGAPEAPVPTDPPPKRQTISADRNDRFRGYREMDPTLDAMADALDLELAE